MRSVTVPVTPRAFVVPSTGGTGIRWADGPCCGEQPARSACSAGQRAPWFWLARRNRPIESMTDRTRITRISRIKKEGGGSMITLTDTASDKVKQSSQPRTARNRCSCASPASGWLLGHELRDVLRHRALRRRRGAAVRRGERGGRHGQCAGLGGATLDFKDGLQGAGFTVNNLNAQRTCGCGQSFS